MTDRSQLIKYIEKQISEQKQMERTCEKKGRLISAAYYNGQVSMGYRLMAKIKSIQ